MRRGQVRQRMIVLTESASQASVRGGSTQLQMQVESRTGARRQPRMENAGTYEEWKAAALAHDERPPCQRLLLAQSGHSRMTL